MSDAQVASMLGIVFFVLFLVFAAEYVVIALAYQRLFKKAGIVDAWMAWIPIVNLIPVMQIIKRHPLNILWILVPGANIVFGIIWMVRLFKAFGMNPLWLLLLLVGFVPYVGGFASWGLVAVFLVMAFSDQYQYNQNFDAPPVFNPQPPFMPANLEHSAQAQQEQTK